MKRLASLVLLVPIALLFAVSCQKDANKNLMGPAPKGTAHIPNFVTVQSISGATFTTDKDDYAPGETLNLSGAGWQANDVLDILLDQTPQNHDPVRWTITVDENGSFTDASYVVQDLDAGVTFTITATSRATGETVTATFTDGTISSASIAMRDASTCTTAQSSVASGLPICAHASFTISGTGATKAQFRWKNPSGAIVQITQRTPNFPNGTTGPQTFSANYTSVGVGTWTVLLCESDNAVTTLTGCQSGTERASQTFTVTAAGPTKLAFTTSAFSGVVGQCLGPITVQTQNASAAGTNPTSAVTVNLTSSSTGGAFSSDAACTTAITTVGIPTTGNSANFYYKDANAGTPTLTAADAATANPLTSATQQQTITDAQAPTINCTVPDQTAWYGDNVTVSCTASDASSGLANSADASFSLSTSLADGAESATAQTNSHEVCDNNSNCATAGPYTFKVDKKDPVVSCGSADGAWHGADVSIGCTATDGGSGLAPADASFSLSTSVSPGTETSNASTGTHNVADGVGNTTTAGPISGNKVDKRDPVVSCGSADGAWHGADVSIGCTATDGGSGLDNPTDANFSLSTSVPSGTETSNASTGTHAVADAVGNSATAGPISGNWVDKKGPVVNLVCPTSPVILGSTAYANWTASDGGSGVAAGYGSGSLSLVTSPVGSKTGTAPAGTSVDNVGNGSLTATCNYSVVYDWTGFFQPVDNNALNVAKAGSAVPVKFNLGGYQGLAIFIAGSPNSSKVVCANTLDQDSIEETVNAGGSSLTYDYTASQYVYVWKSDKSWAGTCRRLDVKLSDGTTHSAYFKWTK